MRIFKGLISVVLVLSFAMGIYCAGTDKTYDFKKHLESIATIVEELPSVEQIGEIWDAPFFDLNDTEFDWLPADAIVRKLTLKVTVDGESVDTGLLYPDAWDIPDWGIFEPINQFVAVLYAFGLRASLSASFVGSYIIGFFNLVIKILPFSGLVERGSI